jgi:small GTP-binding protein
MLRKIFIIIDGKVKYQRKYSKIFTDKEFQTVLAFIKEDTKSKKENEIGTFDFYTHKISYITNPNLDLTIVFISGLMDDIELIQKELIKLENEFLNVFSEMIKDKTLDSSMIEVINPTIDQAFVNLKPKISLIGFSGVGKTTILRLIKAQEIPTEHIPTITGDIATIKIGKLKFNLWDFAGQDQFSFLWNKFIKGSDAVLLITDSTLENIEKSKYFLHLIQEEAPYAHAAVIGNKQDLKSALKPEEIEDILGLKTYSMIAINPDNRKKMITIIADILDMSTEVSPLLKPLSVRDKLIKNLENALNNNQFQKAQELFTKLADICLELGDDSLGREFYQKSEKIKKVLENSS